MILNATSNCYFGACDGSGKQLLVKDSESTVTKCLCKIKEHVIKNINHANIPTIYKGVTVDSFDIDLYELQTDKARAAQAKKLLLHL